MDMDPGHKADAEPGQQYHWNNRGRATPVSNVGTLDRPRRSVLSLAIMTSSRTVPILVVVAFLFTNCGTPYDFTRKPKQQTIQSPTNPPLQFSIPPPDPQQEAVLKAYLKKTFRYFEKPGYCDNVELIGPLPLIKHDKSEHRLTFPDLNEWWNMSPKMRIKSPMIDLPTIEFIYGDGNVFWPKSWEQDDLMYVWMVNMTTNSIYGEVCYAHLRSGKVINTKRTLIAN